MYSIVSTAIVHGIESIPITVEADISEGLPVFEMVGFLSAEVKDITITKLIQTRVERMAEISLFLPNLWGIP